MSYDPADEDEVDESAFALDGLGLADDPSLTHFFSSLEELIGHGRRERLLLSCLGHTRTINEAMLAEARQPVYQKPKVKPNTGSLSGESSSSTSSTVTSPLSSPSSSSASTSGDSAALTSLNRDSRQAELIAAKKREAEQKKKEQRNANMKKWFKIGAKADAKSPTSAALAAPETPKKAVKSASGAAAQPTSPISGQSTLASFTSDSSTQSPITILVTNLALYVLPPAIPVDVEGTTKYFLILNQYHRIALQDILLISLPYRSGISLTGGDYALRINDFCMHLRSGRHVWLLGPRGRRSAVVEVMSDAYLALLGNNTNVQMLQPDYTELISAIVDGTIKSAMKAMRMEWWATHTSKQEGWLVHRSINETTSMPTLSLTATKPNASTDGKSDWTVRWFVLTADNYLLQFDSPAELEAFRTVVTSQDASLDITEFSSAERSKHALSNKLPAHFDYIDIDLTRAVVRRGAAVGSEDLVNGFDVLVFPRSEASGTPVFDRGYTRHLFTVIPPQPMTDLSYHTHHSVVLSINTHYAKRPTVKIPSSQHAAIEPPSPASAKHADLDANRSEAAKASEDGSKKRGGQSFFPANSHHPFAALTFDAAIIDTMNDRTSQWFDAIDAAIHLNAMGGTRSAEDNQGARAAMKKHGYQTKLTEHKIVEDATATTPSPSDYGNGLFKPMIDQSDTPAQSSSESAHASSEPNSEPEMQPDSALDANGSDSVQSAVPHSDDAESAGGNEGSSATAVPAGETDAFDDEEFV